MRGHFNELEETLLVEITVTGAINWLGLLYNSIGAMIGGGTFEVKDHYYALGIGKTNLYIGYLGKYYSHEHLNKKMKLKDVRVIKNTDIKQILVKNALFGMGYKLIIIEELGTHVFYMGKKDLSTEQLARIKR